MTWQKKGTEWPDDCAEAGLSDAAYRTHDEGTNYVYRTESTSCRIKKSTMKRWAGSDRADAAITELIDAGFWIDHGAAWEIIHHADVIRQSIAAQVKHRERNKNLQRAKRRSVDSNVDHGVDSNVYATQSVSQTDSTKEEAPQIEQIDYETGEITSVAASSIPVPERDESVRGDWPVTAIPGKPKCRECGADLLGAYKSKSVCARCEKGVAA